MRTLHDRDHFKHFTTVQTVQLTPIVSFKKSTETNNNYLSLVAIVLFGYVHS